MRMKTTSTVGFHRLNPDLIHITALSFGTVFYLLFGYFSKSTPLILSLIHI